MGWLALIITEIICKNYTNISSTTRSHIGGQTYVLEKRISKGKVNFYQTKEHT